MIVVDILNYIGWIIAIIFGILAFFYYRKGAHMHQIQLEVIKLSRVLDDDYRRTGRIRGIIKFKPDGWPYIAWYEGSEPPPQGR